MEDWSVVLLVDRLVGLVGGLVGGLNGRLVSGFCHDIELSQLI